MTQKTKTMLAALSTVTAVAMLLYMRATINDDASGTGEGIPKLFVYAVAVFVFISIFMSWSAANGYLLKMTPANGSSRYAMIFLRFILLPVLITIIFLALSVLMLV